MSEMPTPTRKILDAWFSQRPTFALMGEFSAGKSTLLNLLLGGDVLLTQVTATNMPVVWMTYAEEPKAFALGRDGALDAFDISNLGDAAHKDKLLLRLEMPIEILKRIDIIDTPGISDPRLAQGALEFLGPYLDFVVWCSAANQAWRQTEHAMWTSLPPRLHAQSIMALTRADTLKKPKDLIKVVGRCEKEAGKLFRDICPVSTVAALATLGPDGRISDKKGWNASHAAALFSYLDVSIDAATQSCAARDKIAVPTATKVDAAKIEKPAKAKAPAKRKVPAKTATPATSKSSAKPSEIEVQKTITTKKICAVATISELSAQIYGMRQSDDTTPSKEQFLDTLEHLFTTFLCETKASDAHQTVLSRAMSLERSGDLPQNEVILQVVQEIEDFAETPWCRLDQIH